MLNYLWAFMILTGILYASFTGNLPAVTEAALGSAQEAVSLCITMAGVLALWVGLMRIAEHAGVMRKATDKIYPLLHFLFPRIPKNHSAMNSIAANCIANFFGLGWAATPAGIQAMKDLAKLENELTMNHVPQNCFTKNSSSQTKQASGKLSSQTKVKNNDPDRGRKICLHGDVCFPRPEHFLRPADPGDNHRLPEPIWLPESLRNHRRRNSGNDSFHRRRHRFYQNYVLSGSETRTITQKNKCVLLL